MKAYCENCKEFVECNIKEEDYQTTIDNKPIKCTIYVPYCKKCGNKTTIDNIILDYNINQAHIEYYKQELKEYKKLGTITDLKDKISDNNLDGFELFFADEKVKVFGKTFADYEKHMIENDKAEEALKAKTNGQERKDMEYIN
jgi:hypothetical protein